MSDENVKAHYLGEQGRVYHERKRGIPVLALPWVARLRAEKFQAHVREEDTVLEYGVGVGWNLAELRCKVRIGFDVSDFLAQPVRELGVQFISETSSVKDSSVDVVICHHTLEHVLHPPEVLREMRRMLRKDGKLLLFVPFEKEKRYRRFDPAEPNHHLYSWNVQTLGNLVSECGLKVQEAVVGEFGYDRFAAVWAERWRLGEEGFRAVRRVGHWVRPGREVRVVAAKGEHRTSNIER